MQADEDSKGSRLTSYEARTDRPLLILALAFVAVYAAQVLVTDLPAATDVALTAVSWAVWAAFAVDLAIRVYLAEQRARYLLTHPLDVLMVVLPALRPLRVLRVFTAGQALLSRGGGLLRSSEAIMAAAGTLVLIASLAMLDAERDVPDSHIRSFGDALWWAATTVTTVGYGDTYPVTSTGRLVAAGLMVVGIALVGLVTGTVAAWFVAQTKREDVQAEEDLSVRLRDVEAELAALHTTLRAVLTADRTPTGAG